MLQCSCFISLNAHTLAKCVKPMSRLALLPLRSVGTNVYTCALMNWWSKGDRRSRVREKERGRSVCAVRKRATERLIFWLLGSVYRQSKTL